MEGPRCTSRPGSPVQMAESYSDLRPPTIEDQALGPSKVAPPWGGLFSGSSTATRRFSCCCSRTSSSRADRRPALGRAPQHTARRRGARRDQRSGRRHDDHQGHAISIAACVALRRSSSSSTRVCGRAHLPASGRAPRDRDAAGDHQPHPSAPPDHARDRSARSAPTSSSVSCSRSSTSPSTSCGRGRSSRRKARTPSRSSCTTASSP